MTSVTDGLRCYYNSSMKEKTPLELERENRILQSNWNSLKDWVFEHIDSIEFNSYDDVLDKMNELEGVGNEQRQL